MTGTLSHIRVLDLSRILAGPWASQMLGDLGAEIIKIERPGSGDDTRGWGPPYLKDAEGQDTDVAAYFLCANRNKKSVTIDMAKPEGQALIVRLVRTSDVLLENFKVGSLQQYGLHYESLKTSTRNSSIARSLDSARTDPMRTGHGTIFYSAVGNIGDTWRHEE
jgi:crotonobetainyl-CoA:carnitine CoA-transferase CaiB-like acyl-CoA transferase